VRIDSTVTEADLKYPTDARSTSRGVRVSGLGGAQAHEADRNECGFITGRQEPGSKTHPMPAATLPSRRGGPCQPPQTPLRARPILAEGRPGRANLD
jgi:hypothetical protein